MQTAGARILPEDNEQELSREAVLLQWERKIEQAERRPSRVDPDTEPSGDGSGAALASAEAVPQEEPRRIGRPAPVVEDATHDGPRRFEQSPAPEAGGRRTITITGHPGPPPGGAGRWWRASWPSPTGSPSGPSCSVSSWWRWPPGPRTPELIAATPAGYLPRAAAPAFGRGMDRSDERAFTYLLVSDPRAAGRAGCLRGDDHPRAAGRAGCLRLRSADHSIFP